VNTAEILERLDVEFDDEGLLKADGFDDAILGVVEGWFPAEKGPGASQHCVVCYDYRKCVEILVAQDMSEEEAEEYLQYNTLGSYVGSMTPVFLFNWRSEDEG